jgi:hypothetical protein
MGFGIEDRGFERIPREVGILARDLVQAVSVLDAPSHGMHGHARPFNDGSASPNVRIGDDVLAARLQVFPRPLDNGPG